MSRQGGELKYALLGQAVDGITPAKEETAQQPSQSERTVAKRESADIVPVSPTMKALEEEEDDTQPLCNCNFTLSSLWYRKKKTSIDKEISKGKDFYFLLMNKKSNLKEENVGG